MTMRRRYTRLVVVAMAIVLSGICAGWAVLVQHVVPSACALPSPPPRAQYLDC